MAKRKGKSGATMLRMSPKVHERVEKAATALGVSMNALLNLMIRAGLPLYEMQANLLGRPETLALWEQWRRLNPIRETMEFFADYFLANEGIPTLFGDGRRYTVEEGRFVDVRQDESLLPIYEVAADYRSDPKTLALLRHWQQLNPERGLVAFLDDCRGLRLYQSCRFGDGKWYRLNAEGDGFVEMREGEEEDIPF